jgi:hypothetical protein
MHWKCVGVHSSNQSQFLLPRAEGNMRGVEGSQREVYHAVLSSPCEYSQPHTGKAE